MNRRLLLTLLVSALCGGCNRRLRNAVEITTRTGGSFVVVEPVANYQRVCDSGEYALQGVPDLKGLRAVPQGQEAAKGWLISGDEIPWGDIYGVVFGDPGGQIDKDPAGDFCPGMPEYVTASVRFKNGQAQQRSLIDTTDRGITGLGERGRLIIPIREIAKLKVIQDERWPWARFNPELQRNEDLPTLRVTETAGKTEEFWAPTTSTMKERFYGQRSITPPDDSFRDGLPALIAGARVEIKWNRLKSVDIAGGDGKRLVAHATYTDGRVERFGVSDGGISTTKDGNRSIEFKDVTRIETLAKAAAIP